jgi:hypothetical protein
MRTLKLMALTLAVAFLVTGSLVFLTYCLSPYGAAWLDHFLGLDPQWKENDRLLQQIDFLETEGDIARRARELVRILGHDWTMNEEGPNPTHIAWRRAYEVLLGMGPDSLPYVEEGLKSEVPLVRQRCEELLRVLRR